MLAFRPRAAVFAVLGSALLAVACGDDASTAAAHRPGGSLDGTGSGASVTPGAGGSVSPGAGGAISTGAGGTTSGSGGETSAGTGGWQELTFTSDTFTVAAGDEVYRAQNFANPIGHDVDIIESESTMAKGSHHMFAFHGASYNQDGAIGDSTGIEFAPYIHTAQTPEQLTRYPAGIGRYLPGADGIRLQVHYINTSDQDIQASVSLRIRYVNTDQVTFHAAEIFLNDVGVRVPPGTSTATTTVSMPYDVKLLGAGSHMHRRAVGFDSTTNDGREIYTTTDWNEPVAAAFDPTIDIAQGGSITWSCTYDNQTGQTLTFGESAATNEMCIFSGVYYPAPNGAGITRQCLGRGSCF
ncbi:MAG TPA: hypothetical protein VHE30_23170 [Polyangiaceae bacterium]|nr:hypothetical protein [Polyangiaceae bacterium]